MQPGPDKIIACPNCGALANVFTLRSGSTFRALRWTDGYTFAPMLPTPPPITRCARCRTFYWVKEARVVGEITTWPDEDADECKRRITPPAWHLAPPIRELTADEYLAALAASAADTIARERELRRLAWWRYNDAFRGLPPRAGCGCLALLGIRRKPAAAPPVWSLSPAVADNLARLLPLLDLTQDRNQVLQAEILRQLGQFDQAAALLSQPFPALNQTAIRCILDLSRQHIRELRQLPAEPKRPS